MLWVSLLLSLATASTLWVKSPQSSVLDYQATLKAHAHALSPTQAYLQSHPLIENREKLLNLFSQAQRDFLDRSSGESRERFLDVLRLLPSDDWATADREIFLQVYLRLAQLANGDTERDLWLTQSLELGDNVNYDKTLFPPPLLLRREELILRLARRSLSRRFLTAAWSQVLLNGRACEKDDCGSWPVGGKLRVTVLSDEFLPQSKMIAVADFEHFHPAAVPWVEGVCSDPHWNHLAEIYPDKKAFWSLDCERPPAALQLSPRLPEHLALLAPMSEPHDSKPFYHSTWFWVGAGLVSTALVVVATQHPREEHQSTTTYGY
jgi:hypothetical protein